MVLGQRDLSRRRLGVEPDEVIWWWLSSERMTVLVGTVDGFVVKTPPIVKKFRGQSITDLAAWFESHGAGAHVRRLGQRVRV